MIALYSPPHSSSTTGRTYVVCQFGLFEAASVTHVVTSKARRRLFDVAADTEDKSSPPLSPQPHVVVLDPR